MRGTGGDGAAGDGAVPAPGDADAADRSAAETGGPPDVLTQKERKAAEDDCARHAQAQDSGALAASIARAEQVGASQDVIMMSKQVLAILHKQVGSAERPQLVEDAQAKQDAEDAQAKQDAEDARAKQDAEDACVKYAKAQDLTALAASIEHAVKLSASEEVIMMAKEVYAILEEKARAEGGVGLGDFLAELDVQEVDKVLKALGEMAITNVGDLLSASSKEDRTELLDGLRDSGVRLGDRMKLSKRLAREENGTDASSDAAASSPNGKQDVPHDRLPFRPPERAAVATMEGRDAERPEVDSTTWAPGGMPATSQSTNGSVASRSSASGFVGDDVALRNLVGTWQYSERGIYDISATEEGHVLFEQCIMGQMLLGKLQWHAPWWQGKVFCDGDHRGDVRVRSVHTRGVVISNFRPAGTKSFGHDNIANRIARPEGRPRATSSASAPSRPDERAQKAKAMQLHARLQKYIREDRAPAATAEPDETESTEGLELRLKLQEVRPEWTNSEANGAVQKLKIAGVTSVRELEAALGVDAGQDLNQRLRDKGLKTFSRATLDRIRTHLDDDRNQRRWRMQLEVRRALDDMALEETLNAVAQRASADSGDTSTLETSMAAVEVVADAAQNPQDSGEEASSPAAYLCGADGAPAGKDAPADDAPEPAAEGPGPQPASGSGAIHVGRPDRDSRAGASEEESMPGEAAGAEALREADRGAILSIVRQARPQWLEDKVEDAADQLGNAGINSASELRSALQDANDERLGELDCRIFGPAMIARLRLALDDYEAGATLEETDDEIYG